MTGASKDVQDEAIQLLWRIVVSVRGRGDDGEMVVDVVIRDESEAQWIGSAQPAGCRPRAPSMGLPLVA